MPFKFVHLVLRSQNRDIASVVEFARVTSWTCLAYFGVLTASSGLAQAYSQAKSSPKSAGKNKVAPKSEETHRQRIFRLMDKNDDEFLSIDEYAAGSLGNAYKAKQEEFDSFDRNGDGQLDVVDFEFRGREPPKQNGPSNRVVFDALDTSGDYRVSLQEFTSQRPKDQWAIELLNELLADRCPPEKAYRVAFFHRFDVDSDSLLEWDEFRTRGKGKSLDSMSRFLQYDTNGDYRVSPHEYSTVRSFVSNGNWSPNDEHTLFDLAPKDGFLTPEEFQFSPAAAPGPEVRFHGKDLDRNEELSPDEMLVFLPEQACLGVLNSFGAIDKDNSGAVDLSEYLQWKKEQREQMLARRGERVSSGFWSSLDTLSRWIILADGMGILIFAGYFTQAWWRRRK